jgi:hypothetical protein
MWKLPALAAYEHFVKVRASIGLWVGKILQRISKSPQKQSNATALNPPLLSLTTYVVGVTMGAIWVSYIN